MSSVNLANNIKYKDFQNYYLR